MFSWLNFWWISLAGDTAPWHYDPSASDNRTCAQLVISNTSHPHVTRKTFKTTSKIHIEKIHHRLILANVCLWQLRYGSKIQSQATNRKNVLPSSGPQDHYVVKNFWLVTKIPKTFPLLVWYILHVRHWNIVFMSISQKLGMYELRKNRKPEAIDAVGIYIHINMLVMLRVAMKCVWHTNHTLIYAHKCRLCSWQGFSSFYHFHLTKLESVKNCMWLLLPFFLHATPSTWWLFNTFCNNFFLAGDAYLAWLAEQAGFWHLCTFPHRRPDAKHHIRDGRYAQVTWSLLIITNSFHGSANVHFPPVIFLARPCRNVLRLVHL